MKVRIRNRVTRTAPKISARIVVTSLLLLSTTSTGICQVQRQRPPINFRDPARVYTSVSMDGRTFRVEQQLVNEDPTLMRRALRRLNENIDVSLSLFPIPTRRVLSPIPFILLYGTNADGGGRDNGLAYFQKSAPLHRVWLDPTWGNSIVVYSAKNYASITDFWAAKSVTHELAHAYQLEQWPEKQRQILSAYKNAMNLGLYHGVMDDKGKTVSKAYAATNQLEYFAELSCMYFVGCNYDPRNRSRLRSYDPIGLRMIEQMWSVKRAPPPTKYAWRVWKDPPGKLEFVARFIQQDSSTVSLLKNDHSEASVPIKRLSEIDRNYLRRVASGDQSH